MRNSDGSATMSKNPFDSLAEYFLSQLPENVVDHLANANKELLRAVQEGVHACVDRTIAEIDARVAGAKTKRDARQERTSTRVTVEEETTTENPSS